MLCKVRAFFLLFCLLCIGSNSGCDSSNDVEELLGLNTVYQYYRPSFAGKPALTLTIYPDGTVKIYSSIDSVQQRLPHSTIDTLARLIQRIPSWDQEYYVPGDFAVESLTRITPEGMLSIQRSISATDIPQPLDSLFHFLRHISDTLWIAAQAKKQ